MSKLFAAGLTAAAMISSAQAAPIVFTGSGVADGNAATASASFDFSGNALTIVLRNTSPSNNNFDVAGSTLTGLFFSLAGSPTLRPISATIAAGSIAQAGTCTGTCTASTTNVGGEFGYQAGSFRGGANQAIASSGYLSSGQPNFNGSNLDNPEALDGINFGIISAAAGFNPNGGLNKDPLIRDSVTFVLSGVTGLDASDISNVSFQYGTMLTEANITGACTSNCTPPPVGVAEPTSMALLGAGLVGLGLVRRRTRTDA